MLKQKQSDPIQETLADPDAYATMKVGDWEYALPRYMQRLLQVAGLADGNYTVEDFIQRIDRVEYARERDGKIALLVNIAKLLFVQFAEMAGPNERIGLVNVPKVSEIENQENVIDLVDRALPKPNIKNA
jgi:hypothetical protein